jgi:gas vesicle protein
MGQNPEELTTDTTGAPTTGYTDTGYVEARGESAGTQARAVPGASTTPADIEATRASLSRDIDELTDKVSPARVVDRQKEAAKEAARSRFGAVREKVMGAAPDLGAVRGHLPGSGSGGSSGPGVGERASGLASDVSSQVSGTVSGSASGAVDTVAARAQGNPLAAGLVAFGAGMVLSALLPASEKETRVAGRAVEAAKEHGQPVLEEARSVGQQLGADLKESAAESAAQVKDTASESVAHVKDEGQSSARTVKDEGQSSAQTVKDEGQSSAQTLKQNTNS